MRTKKEEYNYLKNSTKKGKVSKNREEGKERGVKRWKSDLLKQSTV